MTFLVAALEPGTAGRPTPGPAALVPVCGFGHYVMVVVGLEEFVLSRLAEAEAGWSQLVEAAGPAAGAAGRRRDACRAEIRLIKSRSVGGPVRGRSWMLPELRKLALPYYDHPDYQPDWHPSTMITERVDVDPVRLERQG